jgi:hypothetical protein
MKNNCKKLMIKRIPLVLMTFLWLTCYAQYQERNEISVSAGAGYSTLMYNLNNGKNEPGYGGTVGIGYTFFFNDFFGIGTGGEIGYYNSKARVANFSDRYAAHDGEESFEFRYDVNDYEEEQSLLSVNIPLMLHLQLPLFHDEHLCYIALGGRVGIPISSEYNSSSSSYKTSAYYSQYDVELEGPNSQGLGIFRNRTSKGDFKFETMYMLSAEVGMKWMTSDHYSLYTGVYCDYGLYTIFPNNQQESFLKYDSNNPTSLANISILRSRYLPDKNINSFNSFAANKLFPAALGLKFRLAFRIPDKRSSSF